MLVVKNVLKDYLHYVPQYAYYNQNYKHAIEATFYNKVTEKTKKC